MKVCSMFIPKQAGSVDNGNVSIA